MLARAAWRCFASDARALGASIQDDSYYYLLPAFRYWRDGFFTFDGEHATFGVQPLYAFCLTLLAAPFEDRFAFLRWALFLGYVTHAATALVIYALVRRLARPCGPWGAFAAALASIGYLANMAVLYGNTTAKENSLFGLCLALGLYLAVLVRERDGALRRLALGCVLGLAVSARITPSTLLLAAFLGIVACRWRPRRSLLVGFGAASMILPWLVYASLEFGHATPTSGSIKVAPFFASVRALGLLATVEAQAHRVVPFLKDSLLYSLGYPNGFYVPQAWVDGAPRPGPLTWAMPFLALGLLLVGMRRHVLRASASAWLPFACLAVALAGTTLIPLMLGPWFADESLHYLQWYVADLPVLLAIVLALCPLLVARVQSAGGAGVGERVAKDARDNRAGLLSVGALALLLCSSVALWQIRAQPAFGQNPDSWLHQSIVLSERANERLPDGSRIASANAGAVAYWSRHRVVNVDGLANDDIVEARNNGVSLYDYALAKKLEYLIDVPIREGWFGTNSLDRLEILDGLPFRAREPQGLCLFKRSERRFPDWDLKGDEAKAIPWAARDPLGSEGARRRCFAVPRSGALVFHPGGHFSRLRVRAGAVDGPARLVVTGDKSVLFSETLDARRVCTISIAGVAELKAHYEGDARAVWWTEVEFGVDQAGNSTTETQGIKSYGSGCADSAVVPVLTASRAETSTRFALRNGPADSLGQLVLGAAMESLRLAAGCRLLVGQPLPVSLPLPVDADGAGTIDVPVDPRLVGTLIYAQVLFRGGDRISAVSNGLRVLLGS